jgi:hypothetical protein
MSEMSSDKCDWCQRDRMSAYTRITSAGYWIRWLYACVKCQEIINRQIVLGDNLRARRTLALRRRSPTLKGWKVPR